MGTFKVVEDYRDTFRVSKRNNNNTKRATHTMMN